MKFELLAQKNDALENLAVRKEVKIICAMRNNREFSFRILVYIPKKTPAPAPVFLGLNFMGNHNTTRETDVIPTGCRFPGKLVEPERGVQYSRWIPDELVRQGFASVTCCYHDIFRTARTERTPVRCSCLPMNPEIRPPSEKNIPSSESGPGD